MSLLMIVLATFKHSRPPAARSKRSELPPLQVSEEALGARCNAWVRRAFFPSLSLNYVILMSVEELELLH